jgi:hypothetical protein
MAAATEAGLNHHVGNKNIRAREHAIARVDALVRTALDGCFFSDNDFQGHVDFLCTMTAARRAGILGRDWGENRDMA